MLNKLLALMLIACAGYGAEIQTYTEITSIAADALIIHSSEPNNGVYTEADTKNISVLNLLKTQYVPAAGEWMIFDSTQTTALVTISDTSMEINHDVEFVNDGGLAFGEINVLESIATVSVDSDIPDVLVTQFTTDQSSNNVTLDAANDKITITKPGHYLVLANPSASISAGVATTLHFTFYLNGNETHIHRHRSISTTGLGSIAVGGILDVTVANSDLDLRANIAHTTARNLTVEDCSIIVVQIGGT